MKKNIRHKSIKGLIVNLPKQIFLFGLLSIFIFIIPVSVFLGVHLQKREFNSILKSNIDQLSYFISINDISGINQKLKMLSQHRNILEVRLEGSNFQFAFESPNKEFLLSVERIMSFSDSIQFNLINLPEQSQIFWSAYPDLAFISLISLLCCTLVVILTLMVLAGQSRLSSTVIEPFLEVESFVESVNLDNLDLIKLNTQWLEVQHLNQKFDVMIERLKEQDKIRRELSESQARVSIGYQVAHDIRSPLSFLNILAGRSEGLNQNERNLVQQVVQRLNTMADDLIDSVQSNIILEEISLKTFMETFIQEKKAEFSERFPLVEIRINCKYNPIFLGDKNKMSRGLSNILNNSAEAYNGHEGKISITLSKELEGIYNLKILDKAGGIPDDILEKIMMGESISSKSGHQGIGLKYSLSIFEDLNIKVRIKTQSNSSTEINLSFKDIKS